MKRIALLCPDRTLGFFAYFKEFVTPDARHEWNGITFELNPTQGAFDGVIVHQSTSSLDRRFHLVCPPSKTILAVKEPPDIAFLSGGYVRQFQSVLCHDSRVPRARRLSGPAGHHWFVEVPYKGVEPTSFSKKRKLISAVVSAKKSTKGHRRRLSLMHRLKAHFGDQLDWWGRGICDLTEPKITALKDYKYHIAIENGSWPGYWTEKLIDCYVANCVPIYAGPPDIDDYFDPRTMVPVSIDDPDATIAAIEAAIARDMFAQVQDGLAAARRKILTEYHSYEIYIRALEALPSSEPIPMTIKPQTDFSYSLQDRIVNRVWRAWNSAKL